MRISLGKRFTTGRAGLHNPSQAGPSKYNRNYKVLGIRCNRKNTKSVAAKRSIVKINIEKMLDTVMYQMFNWYVL